MTKQRSAFRSRRRGQKGQAAVEWVLTLPIIIAVIMVLYQVLMFERDVFNKMNLARYEALKRAHEIQNQEGMADYSIMDVPTQGKTVGDLTSFELIAQTVDTNRRYGPKKFFFGCGTKRFFPGGDTAETIMDVALGVSVFLDHFEETAGAIEQAANAIGQVGEAASAVPCEEASGFLDNLSVSNLLP